MGEVGGGSCGRKEKSQGNGDDNRRGECRGGGEDVVESNSRNTDWRKTSVNRLVSEVLENLSLVCLFYTTAWN